MACWEISLLVTELSLMMGASRGVRRVAAPRAESSAPRWMPISAQSECASSAVRRPRLWNRARTST